MKLSVSLITYNHAPFIRQAIESVLMQKTDFDFEILIGEDASADGTREIVKEYAVKHPDKIRLFLHDRKDVLHIAGRPTGRHNFLNNLKNARGQYIALLDGDDYWTCPDKLQTQVDFLEGHPKYALCFTNASVVYDPPGPPSHPAYGDTAVSARDGYLGVIRRPPESTSIQDLARGNYIHTPGVVFRNWLLNCGLPDYLHEVSIGDWPLHMFTALHGRLRYFDEVMVAYRVHRRGRWSAQPAVEREYLSLMTYPAMLRSDVFDESVKEIWKRQLPQRFLHFYRMATEQGKMQEAAGLAEALSRSWGSFACELAREYCDCQVDARELRRIQSFKSYRLLRGIKRLLISPFLQKKVVR